MSNDIRYRLIASDQTKQAFQSVEANLRRTSAAVEQIRNVGAAVLGSQAVGYLRQWGAAIVDARIQTEKLGTTLAQAVGQAGVRQELAFVRDAANRLGLEFNSTASAYAKFAAASRGTNLEGGATRDIFIGVSQAAAALGLSADETSGALLAVQQIISKGKVSAEELRGQLGERLPGAFQIAARAAGVTTQELDRLLTSGSLLADDFLPKFARQLQLEFADAAERAGASTQASVNRITSAWNQLKEVVATGPIGDAAAAGLSNLATNLQNFTTRAREAQASADSLVGKLAAFAPPIGIMGFDLVRRANELQALTRSIQQSDAITARRAAENPGPTPRPTLAGVRALDNAQLAAQAQAERDRVRSLLDQFRSPEARTRDQIEELRRLGASTGVDVSAAIAELRRRSAGPVRTPEAPRSVDDYGARVSAMAAEAVTQSDVVRAREYADTLAELDRLFFQAGLAADVYEAAVRKLSGATTVDGAEGEKRLAERLARDSEAVKREAEQLRDLVNPLRSIYREIERAEQLERDGAIDLPTLNAIRARNQSRADELMQSTAEGAKEAQDAARDLGLTFQSAFEDAIVGGEKLSDVLQSLGQDLLRLVLRRTVTEPLANLASGALGGLLGGLGISARAAGGPVSAGMPYLVGERGPELIVPKSAGTVIPNGGFGGGSVRVVNYVTVDSRSDRASILQAMEQTRRATEASILDSRRRGGVHAYA